MEEKDVNSELRLADSNGVLTKDELNWALNAGASAFRRCHIEPTWMNRFSCKTLVYGRIGNKSYLVYIRVTREEEEENGTGSMPMCLLDVAREVGAEPIIIRINIKDIGEGRFVFHYWGIDEFERELKSNIKDWNLILLRGKTTQDYLRICHDKVSHLKVRPILLPAEHNQNGFALDVDLFVDDVKLNIGTVSMPQLIKSCGIGDQYEIATCTCGVAACAGIDIPYTVVHENGLTVWKAYYLRPRRVFIFETEQYRHEIINKMKDFVGRCKRTEPSLLTDSYGCESELKYLGEVIYQIEEDGGNGKGKQDHAVESS